MEGIVKNRVADGTIYQRRFVKDGTTGDSYALQASAATDKLIGVAVPPYNTATATSVASGSRIDIQMTGIAEVELGGTVVRGSLVTADSNGKAVALSAPGQRIGGIAMASGVSGDIIDLLIIHGVPGQQAGAPAGVTFVIGAENTNAINVGLQLNDMLGTALAVRGSVVAYLSDDANGDSIAGTAPDGGWAIGTDGLLIPMVANKAATLVSEADGDIDITITESAAATWYLVVVLPDGRLVVSEAITFAA